LASLAVADDSILPGDWQRLRGQADPSEFLTSAMRRRSASSSVRWRSVEPWC